MEFENLKKYSEFTPNVNSLKIGLFIKGYGNSFPATAYIRLLYSFNLIGSEKKYSPYIITLDELDAVKKDITNDNFKLDVVIIQRDVLNIELAKILIKKCQQSGIFIIYEIDDDLLNIDPTHPEFDYYKTVRKTVEYIIKNANVCTVSTEQLKEKISDLNKTIYVIPNRLIDDWNVHSSTQKQSNIIKIGYMGTTTHSNDIDLIKKAIINVKNYFKKKNMNIVFELIGGTDNNLSFANKIEIPKGRTRYPVFVKWLKSIANWNIAVAPLEDTFINNSKSELKYLEYSSLGIPGIYSNIGPYKSKITDGYNGLLVNNTSTDWENKIIKLIENKKLQKNIINNSKKDLEENYLLKFSVKQWKQILNLSKFNIHEIDKNSLKFNYNIIKDSYLFDEGYYLTKYPDIAKHDLNPITHYVKHGHKENRDPNPKFSSKGYKENFLLNDDTWNPLTHYILISKFKASKIKINKEDYNLNLKIIKDSQLFDEKFYLNKYPQIAKSNMDPISHYVKYGHKEGRDPRSDFSTNEYKNKFLTDDTWNPFTHYILIGRYEEFESRVDSRNILKNENIIKKSDLFDEKYYLTEYSYLKKQGIDPVNHFVKFGFKESKNPNPTFSTFAYKNKYLFNDNFWNPFTHYIKIGINKKFKTNNFDINYENFSNNQIDIILNQLSKKISVIIPIFNNNENETKNCIETLLKNTNLEFNITLITNKKLSKNFYSYIENLKSRLDITIICENSNIFSLINKCIINSKHDVLFLNNYTQCSSKFLEKLVIKAYSNDKISLVTPLSNLSCGMSPEIYNSNRNPPYITIEGIATLIEKYSINLNINLPFNNCCCLYIKKDCLDDGFNFKKNLFYDLDNKELFLDTSNSTLTNVLDDSTYVFLNPNFFETPELLNEIPISSSKKNKFLTTTPLKQLKQNVSDSLSSFSSFLMSNKILYIIDESDLKFNIDFLTAYNKENFNCYFLSSNTKKICLWQGSVKIHEWNINYDLYDLRNNHLKSIYFNVINALKPDIIQVNSLKYHSFDLLDIIKFMKLPLILDCTNFYYLCPFTKDVISFSTKNICEECIFKHENKNIDECTIFKNIRHKINIEFESLIEYCNAIIFPNKNMKQIYGQKNKFPENLIKIIGRNKLNEFLLKLSFTNKSIHNINLSVMEETYLNSNLSKKSFFNNFISILKESNDNIKIFIPIESNTNTKLINFLCSNHQYNYDLHFLGNNLPQYTNLGVNHGKLSESNLKFIFNEIKPTFVLITNISPNIFNIIKKSQQYQIPILLANSVHHDFVNEINGINTIPITSQKEFNNTILKSIEKDNYYTILKELLLNDKTEIVELNKQHEDIYIEFGNNSQKMFYSNVRTIQNKEKTFSNFEEFLSQSYNSPTIMAKFNEDDKKCFAIMDNISKKLRNNVSSLENKPLVSVIMPVFNRKDTILNAIYSVLNQTYSNIELIIIDDYSTDGTRTLLNSFINANFKIILHEENKGSSYARNTGLKKAQGKYIAYLDSDNEWDERYIETMVGAFLELPDADAIYSGQLLYDKFDSEPYGMRFGSFNKSLLLNNNYIDMNCFCHDKKIFNEIGGFDVNLKRLVDWDFILKITESFKIYSIPVLLSKYYLNNADNRITQLPVNIFNYLRIIQNKHQNLLKPKEYELNKPVSIIIPNKDSLNSLQNSIDNLLSFNLENIEIIIIDNNSNEAVQYYLKNLNHDKIKIIQNDLDYGVTYAINQGIGLISNNSDIIILKNTAMLTKGSIETMQHYAYSLKNVGIIVPQQVMKGGNNEIKKHVPAAITDFDCDITPSNYYKNIVNFPIFHDGSVLELNFAPLFCIYIKREVLNKSMGFDAELARSELSSEIFSEYIKKVMNLNIYHVSEAIVINNSKSKHLKNENNSMNDWDDELLTKLNFKKALWDY